MKNPNAGKINWEALEELIGAETVLKLKIQAIEGFLTQESEGTLLDWQTVSVKEVLDKLRELIDQVIEK